MNKEELVKQIEEINNQIAEISYEDRSAIFDGIVDVDKYLEADLKIMWILKEVNSPDDEDWSLLDVLKDLRSECGTKVKEDWEKTFNPIIYTTYGILSDKMTKEIPKTNENPAVINVLNDIAFVNVKKVSGDSKADFNKLLDFHKKHGSILKRQIETFNPDVIICGNTLEIIDDFGNDYEFLKENNMDFYSSTKHIIVDAYHPNNRTITQEKYCDTIIKNVLEWKEKYKK